MTENLVKRLRKTKVASMKTKVIHDIMNRKYIIVLYVLNNKDKGLK